MHSESVADPPAVDWEWLVAMDSSRDEAGWFDEAALVEEDRYRAEEAPFDDVPVSEMDAPQLVDYLRRGRKVVAQWQAAMTKATARFGDLRAAEGEAMETFAADEIGVTLMLSPVSAGNRMSEASDVVARLPDTMAAFARGDVDAQHVWAIAEVTKPLSAGKAREVEARVLPKAAQPVGRLRQRLRYHVAKVDPEGAKERRRQRQRDRTVEYNPKDDGMASLYALLPAEYAQAAFHRICGLAEKAKTPEDTRSAEQRRADVLTELLLGANQEHVRTEIQVLVPATVLAGASEHPGELAGYGPLDADTVRELARNATWRRILTDPATGVVRDVGRKRYPSPALADYIRMRDRTCRFPGCPRPAARCEIDHSIPVSRGGTTSEDNLGPMCPHHHHAKDHGPWKLHQPTPGHFIWTSPPARNSKSLPNHSPNPNHQHHQHHPTTHRHSEFVDTGIPTGQQKSPACLAASN
ncbi:MAG: DUF222 domain-containing protein [Pseudonocardiaceae bacterium]|nr:DUF222 domain-containing protein [Pseudonocardiaceae bacterium]